MKNDASLKQRDLTLFFIFTFIWSWLFWLPKVLNTAGKITIAGPLNFFLGMFAVFGPSVAAFVLSFAKEGFSGVRQLWKRGWEWKFSKIWLIPTLFLIPATGILTTVLISMLGHDVEWSYALPPIMIIPYFFFLMLTNALPEEFGWRGFALDRLQHRWSALTSSLVLGAVWGLWHLPLFFINGTAQHDAAIPIWQFIVQTMILAVLYTWLHNNTGRSVLTAMLFHASGNTTSAAIPTWTTNEGRWIGVIIQVLITIVVILVWKPKHLTRTDPDVGGVN